MPSGRATRCIIQNQPGVIPVAAYRINAEGETHVLIAPVQDQPQWISLEALVSLSRSSRPN
jgi:hypothetical protein